MFPPHDYPGTEGCEATCEGDDKTEESCTSNFFCEWDGERCWSAVGPNPCPVDEAQMHYFWENYGVEPGMFDHPHDMFPPHDYPGTGRMRGDVRGRRQDRGSCTSNFFCEWDGERCWSAVGPNPCPSDEKEMYDFWEEVHPHDMFPPHEYPGTDGCEATCEGDDKTEEFCTSNFYCEWDGKRAGPLSGRSRAPLTKGDDVLVRQLPCLQVCRAWRGFGNQSSQRRPKGGGALTERRQRVDLRRCDKTAGCSCRVLIPWEFLYQYWY